MGAGRFVCVAVPFGLTLGSLVCILIVMLAGITNKNLEMFTVNTQNLSISTSSLQNLENLLHVRHTTDLTVSALESSTAVRHTTGLTVAALESQASASSASNITAADLGLADKYKVNLFTYCYESGSNTTCKKAKFNWAASALNVTAIDDLATSTAGVNVTLPATVRNSLKTFVEVSKWTQVVYIIAVVTCIVELFLGLFAICSRAGSCITFLISGLSTTTIIAASIMATILSSISTGSIDASARAYGVHASIDTSFLATTWLAVAFSLASGLFWMFTICCCASDHHSSNRRSRDLGDREKLVPTGAYAPIRDSHNGQYPGQQSGIYEQPQYGVPSNVKPARGMAYEPYSHAAI